MSAARIASLRESLLVGKLENRVLGHAIKAEVRQQRVKLLPLHIAHVVWVDACNFVSRVDPNNESTC